MEDYYQLLGLPITATSDQIRQRYHYLAFMFHPDRVQRPEYQILAQADLQRINAAYAVLSDVEQRQRYDSFYAAAFQDDLEVIRQQTLSKTWMHSQTMAQQPQPPPPSGNIHPNTLQTGWKMLVLLTPLVIAALLVEWAQVNPWLVGVGLFVLFMSSTIFLLK
jgi:curved DNA-binding protein CbpA